MEASSNKYRKTKCPRMLLKSKMKIWEKNALKYHNDKNHEK